MPLPFDEPTMRNLATLALPLALAAAAAAPGAGAAEINRQFVIQGAANCQSALPVFDGNIRKRPKALANEGSATAFVTCGFEAAPDAFEKVTRVRVFLLNRNPQATAVTCTGVFGFRDGAFSPSITKTITLSANGSAGELAWTATGDNDGTNFTVPALSCALPPGVEISATGLNVLEEIGA